MFVTNWISTTKIQKISEITNFFRHYFLSRTEVKKVTFLCANVCTFYATCLRTHIIKHMIIGVCLPSLGINEAPININGYQSLPLQMLCFP